MYPYTGGQGNFPCHSPGHGFPAPKATALVSLCGGRGLYTVPMTNESQEPEPRPLSMIALDILLVQVQELEKRVDRVNRGVRLLALGLGSVAIGFLFMLAGAVIYVITTGT